MSRPSRSPRKNGPIGATLARRDRLVDLLDREPLLLLGAPDLADRRVEDPVDDEARHLAAGDRLLADRLGEVVGGLDDLGIGLLALDDLDQRHHRGRVEEVEADDLLGPQGRVAHLGDRERGGVGGEDRVPGRDRVELGVDLLLDLHLLRRRLDHEVDVAEGVVGGRALDQAHDLLEPGVGLLLGQLLLLHQPVELALGHLARLLEAVVDELLVDVLEHDRDVGRGDRLRDLAAHRAGADDRGLEDEHWVGSLRVGVRGVRARREASGRGRRGGSAARLHLGQLLDLEPEAQQRPPQRLRHLAADEEALGRARRTGRRRAARSRAPASPWSPRPRPRTVVVSSPLDSGSANAIRCSLRGSWASTVSVTVPRPAGVERQTSVPPSSGYPLADSTAWKPSTHAGQPLGSK